MFLCVPFIYSVTNSIRTQSLSLVSILFFHGSRSSSLLWVQASTNLRFQTSSVFPSYRIVTSKRYGTHMRNKEVKGYATSSHFGQQNQLMPHYVVRMMILAVMCTTGDQGLQNLTVCLTEHVVRNRFKTMATLM